MDVSWTLLDAPSALWRPLERSVAGLGRPLDASLDVILVSICKVFSAFWEGPKLKSGNFP